MAEHLKRNALDFFAEAEIDIKNGKYNLAIFHLEQALQLALKYVLFQFKGSFEKTHDVIRLLDEVIQLAKNENLRKIRNEEASTLEVIRESYITSRYFPYSVDKIVVEKAYNVVKVILNELRLVE
ncbi:HEPN domain-containing protein [Saccharolobus caldissimus]|uniref:DNA-binding protein n=1 Tax=Saccharolobus caldissimus TaxID=1702097 RepID=A0AAQ4CV38_9CREN|nr:HEPN domain-containing protein [Saccharolobus caldissimus]BDB99669.1 DNA-binding protein [Saccharolobus caldissimus]